MKPHLLSEIFPPHTKEELQHLSQDIKEDGLSKPIITLNGEILDGRHRLKACKNAGVAPKFKEFEKNGFLRPEDLVIKENLPWRKLSKYQIACCAAVYNQMTKLTPQEVGVIAGGSKGKGSQIRVGEQHNKNVYASARKFGCGVQMVVKANTLYLSDRVLFNSVHDGKISIEKAYREYREKSGALPRKGKANVSFSNIDLSKNINIPLACEPHETIHNLIKQMTHNGWIFEMKTKASSTVKFQTDYLCNFYGNGHISNGTNWNGKPYETEFRRAVITAAFEKLSRNK